MYSVRMSFSSDDFRKVATQARPIHCLVMILNLRISPTKQETSSKMMDLGLKKISLSLDKYAESADSIEDFFL